MNRSVVVLALAMLLQACSKTPESQAPVAHVAPTAIAWVKPEDSNIDPIFARARAANKAVFLYWGAVWCPPCNQIKATVLPEYFSRPDMLSNMTNVPRICLLLSQTIT